MVSVGIQHRVSYGRLQHRIALKHFRGKDKCRIVCHWGEVENNYCHFCYGNSQTWKEVGAKQLVKVSVKLVALHTICLLASVV